ncbi:hypothetical protein Tco_0771292 [Tanacetum coccineum]|uniref:Retrotransposon gag domain-containing protein n=1 Tax=Tanacetum coccineum TaxID=301880 RepID=A0ABQ4ZFY1_9ASTR
MMLVPSRKLSVNRESGTACGTGADYAFNFDRIHVLDVYDPVCDTVFLIASFATLDPALNHNGGEEGGDHDGDDGEDNGHRLIGEDDGYHSGEKDAMAARDAARSHDGDDNQNSGTTVRRAERTPRECTYLDYMKYQPLSFKCTEGVVELMQWFEKTESVFRISHCITENQIGFATCTLHGSSLTWWNSLVSTMGQDRA